MSDRSMNTFINLFTGKTDRFGRWDNGAITMKRPIEPQDWLDHLQGKYGVGIVPVMKDGSIRFAALDIDIDTIDHVELAQRIKELGLPLYVCRSKSGAAHAYLFLSHPGKQSQLVKARLKIYAQALGYDKCEIFPKQDYVRGEEVGNWINLPYFGGLKGDQSRCCITAEGKKLTLDEFIEHVEPWPSEKPLPVPVIEAQFVSGPPCLQEVLKQGIPEGQRNQALYNIGVFFKKSNPDGWREALEAFNKTQLSSPIPPAEIKTIIKSLSRKDYLYKCEEDPIVSVCDRDTCIKRRYGIRGNEEGGVSFSPIQITSLEMFKTDNPRWYITIDDVLFDVDTDTLMNYNAMRKLLFEKLPGGPPPMKNETWLKEVYLAKRNLIEIEAPPEASASGQVFQALETWLKRISRDSRALERNTPYLDDDQMAYISFTAFSEFLASKKITELKSNAVASLLRSSGWVPTSKRIKNKTFRLLMKKWDGPEPIERLETIDE